MKKELHITIDSTSGQTKTTIDAKGFTGGACLQATELMEKALGVVSDREMKPESGQVSVQQTQQVKGS